VKKTIYIFSDGELQRKDNTIYFSTTEGKKYLPVEGINELFVFGEVSLNKRFLEFVSHSNSPLLLSPIEANYSSVYNNKKIQSFLL